MREKHSAVTIGVERCGPCLGRVEVAVQTAVRHHDAFKAEAGEDFVHVPPRPSLISRAVEGRGWRAVQVAQTW